MFQFNFLHSLKGTWKPRDSGIKDKNRKTDVGL